MNEPPTDNDGNTFNDLHAIIGGNLCEVDDAYERAEDLSWYFDNVLLGDHNDLDDDDHELRRHIESTTDQGLLAMLSESSGCPCCRDKAQAYVHGRVDALNELRVTLGLTNDHPQPQEINRDATN